MFKVCCCMSGVDKHFGVLLMDYGIHKYVENLWFSILSSKGPKNSIDFQIFSIISFWATEKHFYFFFLFGLRLIFILLYCVAKRREKFVCVHRDYRFAFVCICFYPAFYTQRANPVCLLKLIYVQMKHFSECNCFLGHKVKRKFQKDLNQNTSKSPVL